MTPLQNCESLVQQRPVPKRLTVFLSDAFIERLNAWRRLQADPPTQGMALRILAGRQMDAEGVPPEQTGKEGDEPDDGC
jgi:hypothetical protein